MVAMPVPTDTGTLVKGPPQGRWTFADWEKLPDDGNRYEIIDGVLYMTRAPKPIHQWCIFMLHELLCVPAHVAGLAYTLGSPIGLIMPGCDPVEPDIMMLKPQNVGIIEEDRVYGVPDFIVEVISPSSRSYDEGVKLEAYARAGVPEYVVVDPVAEVLRVYHLIRTGDYAAPQQYNVGDTVNFEIAPSIAVAVSALFKSKPNDKM